MVACGMRAEDGCVWQGQRAAVATATVWVLRVGIIGVLCGRCSGLCQARVQRLAVLQPARSCCCRSCALPLQWQAKKQQESKQTGTHKGWIVRCVFCLTAIDGWAPHTCC